MKDIILKLHESNSDVCILGLSQLSDSSLKWAPQPSPSPMLIWDVSICQIFIHALICTVMKHRKVCLRTTAVHLN